VKKREIGMAVILFVLERDHFDSTHLVAIKWRYGPEGRYLDQPPLQALNATRGTEKDRDQENEQRLTKGRPSSRTRPRAVISGPVLGNVSGAGG